MRKQQPNQTTVVLSLYIIFLLVCSTPTFGQHVQNTASFQVSSFTFAKMVKNGEIFYQKGGGAGGGRGFNIAAINPKTGELLEPVRNFDTWATARTGTAMLAMIDFLDRVPVGTILLLSIADEGGLNNNFSWTQTALVALEKLGSSLIRNYEFRYSWAMITVKGQGAALEEGLSQAAWHRGGKSVEISHTFSLDTHPKLLNRHQDFDGNGTGDILWRNSTSGQVAIWLMNGITIESSGFIVGVPLDWEIAGTGDINGDGKADVIWHHRHSGAVAVWLMDGLTISTVGFPGNMPTDWENHGIGDLNGNGTADILWRNIRTGQVAIWLMEGETIASTGTLVGAPMEWQIAGVGDVDADGKADVIWRNITSGTVAVWLMNGLILTSTGFPGSASTDWNIQKVGDIDGDGKADLIWLHTNGGGVAVWLMNGVAIASSGFPGGVPAAWQIAQVGDIDGNQTGDVIWRNTTNGLVAVWLMDGLTISSVGFPGSTSTDWEIQ